MMFLSCVPVVCCDAYHVVKLHVKMASISSWHDRVTFPSIDVIVLLPNNLHKWWIVEISKHVSLNLYPTYFFFTLSPASEFRCDSYHGGKPTWTSSVCIKLIFIRSLVSFPLVYFFFLGGGEAFGKYHRISWIRTFEGYLFIYYAKFL